MNQIRIAALSDLNSRIPAAHYMLRPHSIDADLELTRLLLSAPEGLTLREHRAAQALQDWAYCEKRLRAISDTAYPVRDCDDPTPAPGMTTDQDRELTARREVHRRSALEYARMLGDEQLIERYQTPVPALTADTAATSQNREERQDSYLRECESHGLNFKDYKGRLPDGVGKVAESLGKKRQPFSKDVKAALERRKFTASEGGTVHRA